MNQRILIALVVIAVLALLYYGSESFSIGRDERTRVVVYHFTPWCPACKIMTPRYLAVKESLRGSGIKFIENDETKNPTEGVTGYPAFTMIDINGKRLRRTGVCSPDQLLLWITSPSNFAYTPTGYRRR